MDNKKDELEFQNSADKMVQKEIQNKNDEKTINATNEQKELNFQNDNININLNIENSTHNNSSKETITIVNNNNNKIKDDNQNINQNINKTPSILLQEKLKNIFLEREKAKLKYNKQSIPDQLKYTSDDEDSNFSKELLQSDIKNKNKDNIDYNKNINIINSYNAEIKEKEKNEKFVDLNKNENTINEEKEINKKEEKEKEININDKNEKNTKTNINNDEMNNNNIISDNNKGLKESKSFKRRNNYIKTEEDNKEKNLYQLLLSKKMKNMVDSDDEEENGKNSNKNNEIKKNDNNPEKEKKQDIIKEETNVKINKDNEINIIKEEKKEKILKNEVEKKEVEQKEEIEIEIKHTKDKEQLKLIKEKEIKKDENQNIKDEREIIKGEKGNIKDEKEKNELTNLKDKIDNKKENIKSEENQVINSEKEKEKEAHNNLELNPKIENNNIEIKNKESGFDKFTKYSTKTYFRNSGVIQLNQNIIIDKNNSFEKEEKGTELPTPQKNKLTINLKTPVPNENAKKTESSKISPKNLENQDDKSKTITRFNKSNSKTIKEEPNDKSNIMKLLQLIKNKKNEREQINKEKEKAKDEMYKRAKSQSVSKTLEGVHKFKDKPNEIEETKEKEQNKIIQQNNQKNKEININNINNNFENSPKHEIYSRKNKINNNKFITNYKSRDQNLNINIKNVKTFENQNKLDNDNNNKSPKKDNKSKSNNKFWSSSKIKKMDRIVVNHRMKKKINNSNIKNKNNENFKDIIKRYATSNYDKNNKKEKDLEIGIKKSYEKPVFIYNKHYLQNRSLDYNNPESINVSNNNNNNINIKSSKIINNINNSAKIYNPKKGLIDKGKSVGKFSNNINNKEYYSNNNNYIYNYNYNNYVSNNNNNLNNIYIKKKSVLLESNVDTNTSSSNLSKSINNQERNKQYYSIKNKKENIKFNTNNYSMIPPHEDNSNKKINLKVNKKPFYINDNSKINNNNNNENESSDMAGRSFISDMNNIFNNNNNSNYNKNNNSGKMEENCDSYLTNKNTIVKSYNAYIDNYNNLANNNANQPNRKSGLQKYSKNRKEILMDYTGEENKSLHNINNYYNINSRRKKIEQKKCISLKFEDLLVIEEKINIIIEYLKLNKDISKQCFDFWNFFFNCSIFKKIEKIFDNDKDINIAKLCINYELISLIVCYEYSLDQDVYLEINNQLLEIMELNYNNLMRLIQQIINIIGIENNENNWIKKLLNIFEMYSKREDFFIYNEDVLLTIEKIQNNNENINFKILNLLNYYQTENNTLLLNYFLQIKTKTYEDLNAFFQNNILQIENEEGSLIAALYLRNNSIFSPEPPPYLKTQNTKKYTLVLDLDETLVNFKIKKGREGYVRLRPFLFGFLEEVSQYYELIIFTSATEAYANSVIEAIEHDKKYFDYIFYRQHTIIVGNDFVKDLTRIGRPLNSTIIIDNMPQNFRFQKENGICIKPFWGQDSNDKTLYDLMPILLDIAKNGGDVRISLNSYKDEIMGKITSSISKNKS